MTGPELKRIRESFGMTQAEFAQAVGLEGAHARGSIGRMERGKLPIGPQTALIAELLVENRRLREKRARRKT